ncbi:peptidoglycan DD-metalloendopeptidase family protein [Dyadobacter tibetensis]|uniref:peptidoglycan DD-metalloendopeptidase family protein n=1 Tax=Dyadobacter tibetensis TaxID=1211851 RepID=UPI0004710C66|nr:peptidoglycan DD-metalloendopeptidase family protein [Dyadobacter tibetensis]
MKIVPYLIFILFFLKTDLCFAQTEKEVSRLAATQFELAYNRGDFEAIFENFSLEMQRALPWTEAQKFLIGLRSQSGNILKRSFVGYEKSYASYKTQFERNLLTLNIFSTEDGKIGGLLVKPFEPLVNPRLERNLSPLILPFREEWHVVWGGDTKEQNYHIENQAQKHAFDMVMRDQRGLSFKTNGITNEDYYAFGRDIIAPCEGEVVLVVDGIKDNEPGVLNPTYVPGNTVILRTSKQEYIVLAHFKQHSILVKQGQSVRQGDPLGLCGNSGNSSEPHLHFHMQNIEDMNRATGVKIFFENVGVNETPRQNYSPLRGDKVKNITVRKR